LAHLDKDLNEEFLLRILNDKSDYFSLSVIAYYLRSKKRKFKYPDTRKVINSKISDIIKELEFEYPLNTVRGYDQRQLKNLIASSNLVILHDFYSSSILSALNQNRIRALFNGISNSIQTLGNNHFAKLFAQYVVSLDKPFINWKYNKKESIDISEIIEWKLKNQFVSSYDI
jgi:hypothetical protein